MISLRAMVLMKSWNWCPGGTSLKSTWMFLDAIGELQPELVSKTVQCIVVPGGPASKMIWRVPWPAVIVPPAKVHV